jgi:hypothetical protein
LALLALLALGYSVQAALASAGVTTGGNADMPIERNRID